MRIIHKALWRDDEIRCLHYILDDKPWQTRVGELGTGGDYEELNRWWWEELDKLGEEMKVDEAQGWEVVLKNVAKG